MLFSISQGFSVPYQFLFREWIELPAVLRTEVTGWDMQWLFSASVTFYVLDYPYCGYWQIFILCNSWVIIPLKTYKPAFLLIKYPCSIRAWVPVSFSLSFFLSLSLSLSFSLSLSRHRLQTARFWSIKGPQQYYIFMIVYVLYFAFIFFVSLLACKLHEDRDYNCFIHWFSSTFALRRKICGEGVKDSSTDYPGNVSS